jgi:hypothetical protein
MALKPQLRHGGLLTGFPAQRHLAQERWELMIRSEDGRVTSAPLPRAQRQDSTFDSDDSDKKARYIFCCDLLNYSE